MTRSRLLLALAVVGFLSAPALAATGRTGASAARRSSAPGARAERARWLMGTTCIAVAEAADTARAGRAIGLAFDEIARLEDVMTSWRNDSELQRMNAAAGADRWTASPDLFAVLDSARSWAEATEGAFDPTVEPLDLAWDLRGRGRVPEPAERSEARDLVGWRMLDLDPERHTVRFQRSGMGVDLGGIGKGYALDRAAETMRRNGVTRALLNFGGEILAFTRHEPWQVTVADPADRERPAVRLALANAAMSTSAQSERGFEVGGVRYGHVLDPRQGAPVRTEASVTVVAASGTRADAVSTALLVMGRDEAAAFLRERRDLGVLWLEPAGHAVRAWSWNLPAATPEPGVTVQWMERN